MRKGGRYIRDPETKKVERVEHTEPAASPADKPAKSTLGKSRATGQPRKLPRRRKE